MTVAPSRADPPLIPGFSLIADRYDAMLCDVWGVLHNGVAAFEAAFDVLVRFRQAGGRVVLITNAPRPAAPIFDQLASLGITRQAYDDVVTSGDVTREALASLASAGRRAVHMIGPTRDLSLIEGLDIALVGPDTADVVLVTGLHDDTTETPDDYRDDLSRLAARGLPFVCANPDRVVERGGRIIWCAGALADVYAEYGGTVTMVGKPHAPIYALARARLNAHAGREIVDARIIAVGDGLPTDIAGGVREGLDVLFVTAGIHGADFGPHDRPDPAKVAERLGAEGLKAAAIMPRLVW